QNETSYITHIGTGNYNETTAKLYTDLNLITARKQIGQDAALFFRHITAKRSPDNLKHFLAAPTGLKLKIMQAIDQEIAKAKRGMSAGILIKSNALSDKGIIEKLAEASQAGVKVQLIIRGICCLLPQIRGKTENITVRSIVGRFLEHSRIY